MSMFAVTQSESLQDRRNPDPSVRYPIVQFHEVISIKPAYCPDEIQYMLLESTGATGNRAYLSPSWPVFDNLDDAHDYRNMVDQIDGLNKKIQELRVTKESLSGRVIKKSLAPTHVFRSNKPRSNNFNKITEFKASGKEEVLTLIG